MAAGTTIAYTLVGAGNAANATASGIFTVDSSGKAVSSAIAVPTNAVYGDSGTMTLALANGKATAVVSVTDSTAAPTAASQTYLLTTDQDTATSSVFSADLSTGNVTLQGLDSLTGTAGSTNNTLKIAEGTGGLNNVLPTGLTLSNIQNVNATFSGNAGKNLAAAKTQFNTSTLAGVTSVAVTSNGVRGDDIKAAATTNVTETYNGTSGATGAASDAILILGGKNVTVTDNGSYAGVTVGGATAILSPVGAVVVTENALNDNVATQSVTVDGGTTVNVTTAATGGVTIGANLAPTGAVTVADTGGADIISLQGGASASVSVNTTAAASSVQVTSGVVGASTINVAGVAASAAGIEVTGGTGVTITTTGAGRTSGTNGIVLGGAIGTPGTVTTAVAGNATITDTFSGPASRGDLFNVTGVTGTVNLTTTATNAAINVGVVSPTYDPTGNVTIFNDTVVGSKNYYGTSTTNVYTNGATAVSVTGAGATTIIDEGAVAKSLTAVTLTGVQGAAGITSSKLATLNINNSTLLNPLNVAVTGTVATVTNSTTDHTLAVNLNGATASTTKVTDANAQVINVTATGGSNVITLDDQDVPALSGAKTFNFVNNGTGTLTVAGVTNTGATTNVTLGGTGAKNLGDTTAWTVAPTSIIDSGSGNVTVTVDGQNTSFTGGSGNNTVTVSSAGSITQSINGGTGSNNTLIATSAVGNYSAGFGGSLSGFQNFELKGGSVTSDPGVSATYYPVGSAYKNLLVSGLTGAQQSAGHGNSVTFSGVGSGIGLTNLIQPNASISSNTKVYTLALSQDTNNDKLTVKVSGNVGTFTLTGVAATDAGTIATYFATGAGAVPGVTAGAQGSNVIFTSTTGKLSGVSQQPGLTESATLTSTAGINAGETLIFGGLTFTAGLANLTQAQVDTVFASLVAGATTGPATALGAYSGTLAGWNTGPAIAHVVTAFSTINNANVTNAAVTGTGQAGVTVVATDGATTGGTTGASYSTIAAPSGPSVHKFTLATDVADGNYLLTVNGVTATVAATTGKAADANSLAAAFQTTNSLPGVTVTSNGVDTIYIWGASTVATSVTGTSTLTTGNTLSGVITDNLSTAAAAATGNTLPITLNSANGIAGVTSVIQEANNQTITINSVKDALGDGNTLRITDGTLTAAANQATTVKVTGAGGLTLTYSMDGTAANALATIDASGSTGSVNVGAVQGAATGMTITGGTGALTASGSGMAVGQTASAYYGAIDTITVGAGGGTITTGYAGATVNAGSGTQTINLSASATVADTIKIGAVGQHAVVNGYQVLATTKSDKVNLNNLVTSSSAGSTVTTPATNLLSNVTTATSVPSATGTGSNTYKVSNGVITFTGTDTGTTLIADAEAIVNATGANTIAAFTANGNTYVVMSDGSNTIAGDTVITLNGVSGVTGFGMTAAAGTILLTGAASSNASALVGTAGVTTNAHGYALIDTATTAVTQDDAGFFEQYYSGVTTGAKVYNNLAASAVVDSASTGTAATYTLSTTQVGAAGTNSITLNLTGIQTIAAVNFTGDYAATIKTTANSVITALNDSGNTLTTLTLSGGATAAASGTLEIDAIADTALTSISVSNPAAVLLGSSLAPLTQTGLTVTVSTTTLAADAIYLNGPSSTINLGGVTTGNGSAVFSATGAGSKITGGVVTGNETLQVGNNGTVTLLQGVAAVVTSDGTYAGTNGNTGAAKIIVGTNSTVTLGTTAAGAASDGGSTIEVWGNVTGSKSSGTYTLTTVANVVDGAGAAGTHISFFQTAGAHEKTPVFVNVASATSLSAALDLAAANVDSTAVAGDHSYAWFQYAGNDYIVAHTGAAATALTTTDIVVKVVGLVDLVNIGTNQANMADSGYGLVL